MTSLIFINFTFTAIFVGGAIYFWLKTAKLKTAPIDWEEPKDFSLISVSVPKNNDRTPQAAEQMFAALHGIFRSGATTQPQISFEIVSKDKVIVFYVYMPTELKDFVSSQIFAQYPTVEIKDVPHEEDYTHLDQSKALAATELTLKKEAVYPIKTFLNFEVDPLSGITGVLSSVGQDEEIWIQMIVRPIDDDWQEAGPKAVKNIKEPPPKHVGMLELMANEVKSFSTDFARAVVVGPSEPDKKDKKDEKKSEDMPGPVKQAIQGIEEKTTKLGYETTIRLLAASTSEQFAQAKLEQVIGAFKQYSSLNLNAFVSKEISNDKEALRLFTTRAFVDSTMIFNVTEIASLYHFPSETVATPTIAWAGSKKGEPPANLPIIGTVPADELTVFAQTNFRNEIRRFGIKRKDRRLHAYIIGKTGTGKSTFMENMIFDDIREGRGVAVVDPHGELIDHVLDFIPEDRVRDVVYFNPADHDHPIGFNILENDHSNPEMKNVIASGVVGIFKKIFGESWGPRLEYILRNAVLALLEYPNSSLLGVMRILTDNAFRRLVINEVKDPVIRSFFVDEYEKYDPKFRQEAINPIQNKVGQFLSSSTIRNIIGQPRSTINIPEIMDTGKILLADLSTGKIGEDNSALLGSMLITKIQLAAMGRTHITEEERRDFYLYVDEFQNFATDSFATILSEARKYRLNLVMTNQYISQMPETVANAVFGNVGTMVAFRVGAADAEHLKQEFEPVFDVNDLVNLPNRQIYLKMAIDGVTVPAFSASTLPPPEEKAMLHDEVVAASREQYSRSRSEVEDYITDWSAPINLSGSDHLKATSPKDSVKEVKTELSEKPVEKPAEAPVVETPTPSTPEPLISEEIPKSTELDLEEKPDQNRGVPSGMKMEIIKDRFNRAWYAVKEQGSESKETGEQQVENRGEPSESDHLITWDQAEELGITPEDSGSIEEQTTGVNRGDQEEILPIEEIR